MIPTLAVAGGGDAHARATVAVNLAVALSALGLAVELADRSPGSPLVRALAGPVVTPGPLVLDAGAGLGLSVSPAAASPAALRLVDAGSALDAVTLDLLRAAALVVVPLDASDAGRASLDAIRTGLDGHSGALLVLLSRQLPRVTDRWSLVDDLEERYSTSLSPVTVPMGRSAPPASAGRQGAGATLYAPTGRAARSYRAVGRDIAARLGLAPVADGA